VKKKSQPSSQTSERVEEQYSVIAVGSSDLVRSEKKKYFEWGEVMLNELRLSIYRVDKEDDDLYEIHGAIQRQCNTASLTLILLTSTKWWAPASVSKWRMGFNSAFKGLMTSFANTCFCCLRVTL
jgi:hypothetical protein